ncbi:MAG: DNA glycosylase [Verrucomicrobiota bacterium]
MLIKTPDFSLADTLTAGQTFCWNLGENENTWNGWIQGNYCCLKQKSPTQLIMSGSGLNSDDIRAYLGLNDDPMAILQPYFEGNQVLKEAVTKTRQLRCVQEPWWECTANFICSSLKQIPHIRQLNTTLRERFGDTQNEGISYTYPHWSRIARIDEEDLRRCRLGYRAKFLLGTARMIENGQFDPNRISNMETEEASNYLQRLPGVGEKIAHCILLYAWRRFDAFPIDVWIARAMHTLYFKQKKMPPHSKIHLKSRRLFGAHRGLAQLHLFHWTRVQGNRHKAS